MPNLATQYHESLVCVVQYGATDATHILNCTTFLHACAFAQSMTSSSIVRFVPRLPNQHEILEVHDFALEDCSRDPKQPAWTRKFARSVDA
jgi:hypothetical protein